MHQDMIVLIRRKLLSKTNEKDFHHFNDYDYGYIKLCPGMARHNSLPF